MRRRHGRDHRGHVGYRRDRRSAGRVRAAQRAAMRLLHARHARRGAGTAEARRRAEPRRNPRTSLRQLLPLHRLSRDRRCGGSGGAESNKRARERSDENHRRLPARAHRARPAEFLHRPLGAAAESGAADARARAICQRRHAAAHGACRLRALAARPRAHRRHRRRRGEESAGRDRGGHRRRTGEGHHALGRRAHASQGPQIGAASTPSPSSAPAGRARRSAPWSRARAPRPRTPASWSR